MWNWHDLCNVNYPLLLFSVFWFWKTRGTPFLITALAIQILIFNVFRHSLVWYRHHDLRMHSISHSSGYIIWPFINVFDKPLYRQSTLKLINLGLSKRPENCRLRTTEYRPDRKVVSPWRAAKKLVILSINLYDTISQFTFKTK